MITARYRAQSSTWKLKTKEVQSDPLSIDHENNSRILFYRKGEGAPFAIFIMSYLFCKCAPSYYYTRPVIFIYSAELLLQTIRWKIMPCAMVLNEDRNYADRKIALVLFRRIKGAH